MSEISPGVKTGSNDLKWHNVYTKRIFTDSTIQGITKKNDIFLPFMDLCIQHFIAVT